MRITVKRMFPGEAPEDMRREFIGLVFEAEPLTLQTNDPSVVCGWYGGQADSRNLDAYCISVSEVFHVLARKSQRTVDWLRKYTVLGQFNVKYILIGKDYCEVVTP